MKNVENKGPVGETGPDSNAKANQRISPLGGHHARVNIGISKTAVNYNFSNPRQCQLSRQNSVADPRQCLDAQMLEITGRIASLDGWPHEDNVILIPSLRC